MYTKYCCGVAGTGDDCPVCGEAYLPTDRMITMRIDAKTHEQLAQLAEQRQLSLNGLCVTVLQSAVVEAQQPDKKARRR